MFQLVNKMVILLIVILSRDPRRVWKFRFQNRWRVATLSHLRQVINGNKLRTSSTCLEDRCLGSICYELYCCRFSHLRTILKSGHFVPVLVRSGLCRQLIGKRESIQNG